MYYCIFLLFILNYVLYLYIKRDYTFSLHQLEKPIVLRISTSDLMCKDAADFPSVHVRSYWKRSGI